MTPLSFDYSLRPIRYWIAQLQGRERSALDIAGFTGLGYRRVMTTTYLVFPLLFPKRKVTIARLLFLVLYLL
jgi:hypothetical protein